MTIANPNGHSQLDRIEAKVDKLVAELEALRERVEALER